MRIQTQSLGSRSREKRELRTLINDDFKQNSVHQQDGLVYIESPQQLSRATGAIGMLQCVSWTWHGQIRFMKQASAPSFVAQYRHSCSCTSTANYVAFFAFACYIAAGNVSKCGKCEFHKESKPGYVAVHNFHAANSRCRTAVPEE